MSFLDDPTWAAALEMRRSSLTPAQQRAFAHLEQEREREREQLAAARAGEKHERERGGDVSRDEVKQLRSEVQSLRNLVNVHASRQGAK